MSDTKEKYFNFPIQLLEDFLNNDKQVLNNICDYAVYSLYLKLLKGNEEKRIKASASYFNLTIRDNNKTLKRGEMLTDSIPANSPMVGLNVSIFFDYYKNDKTEFEKITLLGYLAIKSILLNKSYCKITNNFWLARMDGKPKSVNEVYELSEPIRKYANEYQTKKIKNELRDNWNLNTYSRFTRGFYVSFKITLEQLVFEAEKRRKSVKERQNKDAEKEAVKVVLERLYGTRP